MWRLAVAALVAALAGCSRADDVLVLAPPQNATGHRQLLVFVPGGKVPNTVYLPVLKALQEDVAAEMDLWVSVAACPGRLCIPYLTAPWITAGLKKGQGASGVADPKRTWLAGHSLGAVAGDTYIVGDKGKRIGAGTLLWAGYVQGGLEGIEGLPHAGPPDRC